MPDSTGTVLGGSVHYNLLLSVSEVGPVEFLAVHAAVLHEELDRTL